MHRVSDTVLAFATSDACRWLSLGLLTAAVLVGSLAQRRLSADCCHHTVVVASIFLATHAMAVPFAWLADARGVPPELWSAPFERLLATAALVLAAWALLPRPPKAPYPALLIGTLALAAAAFLLSAATGKQIPASSGSGILGLGGLADLAASGIAVAVIWARRTSLPEEPWLLAILTCQAAAGILEVNAPLSLSQVVWWRLAAFSTGLILTATAFGDSLAVTWPPSRGTASAEADRLSSPAAATTGDRAVVPPEAPSLPNTAGAAPTPTVATGDDDGLPPARPEPAATQPDESLATSVVDVDLERVARFESAMLALPTGVVVTDSQGQVLFSNTMAERLLLRPIQAGQPAAELFPDPPLVDQALHGALATPPAARAASATDLPGHGLRLLIHSLARPDGSIAGALLLLGQPPPQESPLPLDLVPRLAAAICAPMANLAGYSDLLARREPTSGEQDQRWLERVDANLDRMRLGLNNLLAIVALAADKTGPCGPLDPARLLAEAAEPR